jgi:hypothetical protein
MSWQILYTIPGLPAKVQTVNLTAGVKAGTIAQVAVDHAEEILGKTLEPITATAEHHDHQVIGRLERAGKVLGRYSAKPVPA